MLEKVVWQSILMNMPVIVYCISEGDGEYCFREFSGAGAKKISHHPEAFVGSSVKESMPMLHEKLDTVRKIGKYFAETRHTLDDEDAWFFHYLHQSDSGDELIGFALDVTSVKKSQHALLLLNEEKRQLARSMLEMQENIQREVAMNLHDELGQSITAIRTLAVTMLNGKKQSAGFQTDLAEDILDLSNDMYQSAYELMYRLRPTVLDSMGLEQALESCVNASGLRKSGVVVTLHTEGDIDALDQLVQLIAYRVVQEALTNISKYACADNVVVSVIRKTMTKDDSRGDGNPVLVNDILDISVIDNGVGFDQIHKTTGMGIVGLGERVKALGGVLNISSEPGQGVDVHVRINLRNKNISMI